MELIRVGVNEGFGEEARKVVTVGAGMATGFAISEFTSEFIVKKTGVSGSEATIVKAMGRLGIAAIFAVLSFMTGGLVSVLLFSAAAGSVGGIIYDFVSHYILKGSPASVAERMAVASEVTEIVRSFSGGEGEKKEIKNYVE